MRMKMPSFLDLPAELRNRVYHELLVFPDCINIDAWPLPPEPAREPDRDRNAACFDLMRTCRQIYEETSRVF